MHVGLIAGTRAVLDLRLIPIVGLHDLTRDIDSKTALLHFETHDTASSAYSTAVSAKGRATMRGGLLNLSLFTTFPDSSGLISTKPSSRLRP